MQAETTVFMASAQCCSSSYVDTHRHTKTGRHTGTHTDTHTESHTNTHKRTHTNTYRQTHKNAHIHFIAHRRSQGRALAQKHTCTSSQRGARAHAEIRPRSVPIRIDASTRAGKHAHPYARTHARRPTDACANAQHHPRSQAHPRTTRACYPKGCASPGCVQYQGDTRESMSKLKRTSPQQKNRCDKQASSWKHISCHTDKNRYYT